MEAGVGGIALRYGLRPDLSAPPAGEAFLDLYLDNGTVAVRTAKGWMDPFHRILYPAAEASTAVTKAELEAVHVAVIAEERARNPQNFPKSAADIAAEKAAGLARRKAYLAKLRQRMQDANAGKIGGYLLTDLERDVMASQLEGEYEAMGMRMSPDLKRQICRQRQSSICDRSAPSSPSGSGYVSTWENAFENARALNQSQHRENCAAAAKGASRICRQY